MARLARTAAVAAAALVVAAGWYIGVLLSGQLTDERCTPPEGYPATGYTVRERWLPPRLECEFVSPDAPPLVVTHTAEMRLRTAWAVLSALAGVGVVGLLGRGLRLTWWSGGTTGRPPPRAGGHGGGV